MATADLTTFWIKSPIAHAPLGFGVTAWSLDDAIAIIRAFGYGEYLPSELARLKVTEGIAVAELDKSHVVANMGPVAMRGIWYPFVSVGVPRWAEERLANQGI